MLLLKIKLNKSYIETPQISICKIYMKEHKETSPSQSHQQTSLESEASVLQEETLFGKAHRFELQYLSPHKCWTPNHYKKIIG